MIPVCEGRGGFGKSVDELAVEYALLQQERPQRRVQFSSSEELLEQNDIYRAHMHQEYLRYEEMIRRIGLDRTIALINQTKDILQMMGI